MTLKPPKRDYPHRSLSLNGRNGTIPKHPSGCQVFLLVGRKEGQLSLVPCLCQHLDLWNNLEFTLCQPSQPKHGRPVVAIQVHPSSHQSCLVRLVSHSLWRFPLPPAKEKAQRGNAGRTSRDCSGGSPVGGCPLHGPCAIARLCIPAAPVLGNLPDHSRDSKVSRPSRAQ